jgi:hypothetical protein
MKLTNNQIYDYATRLAAEFSDNSLKLPIKVNFYLQKNKAALMTLAQDLEQNRQSIIENYGQLNDEGTQYIVPTDKIEAAQQELSDLFSLEQEVNIYKINIDTLSDDLVLSAGQMEALMFMID